LASYKLSSILGELREKYDVVLFDSPPVIAVTDATILSTVTDGILLVVRANKTDTRALQRAVELLSHVKCNVLGAVLNGVSVSGGYGSYYYYYHYYYYYGDGHRKKKRAKRKKRETRAY
ncbi:MAG: hypothetical protein J7K33_07800, partial [Candidatus Marinimicrobia bacterium]|nr:hypothetical protein [Candidatus Neomarinimicrobiota bacterium]